MLPSGQFGDYRILRVIGQGGMGTVCLAVQRGLERTVALKVLHPDLAGNKDSERRFRREIQLAATFQHPGLVRVFDGGVEQGLPYLVMEYVSGQNLEQCLTTLGRLPWPLAVAMVQQACDALAYLHAGGVFHRDIKPSNLLYSDQCVVKLADFGLARKEGNTLLTNEGDVVGTLRYMAPEMVCGDNATIQSDIWSMGGVLFTLLTGEAHIDVRELMERPTAARAYPVPERDGFPRSLVRLLSQLLVFDPAHRPRDTSKVKAALEAILSEAGQPLAEDILQSHPMTEVGAPAAGAASPLTQVTPPSPRSARRNRTTDRTPAPARARPRSKGAPVLGGLTVLLAVAVLGLWPASRRSPPAVVPTARPSPRPTPVAHRGLFEEWRAVVPFATALSGSRNEALAATAQLKRRVKVSMGGEPAHWLYWMHLGQWLADPNRSRNEPRGPAPNTEPMDYIQEQAILPNLWHLKPDSSGYSIVILGTAQWPMDGRFWLAFGRTLSLDGYPELARVAYTVGLERLGKNRIEVSHSFLNDALMEAVTLASTLNPDQLARILTTVSGNRPAAWNMLRMRLGKEHRPLLEAILLRAQVYDPGNGVPAMQLATLKEQAGLHEEARNVLKVAVARYPYSEEVRQLLAMHYMIRGLLEDAQPLVLKLPADNTVRRRFTFISKGTPPPLPSWSQERLSVADIADCCDLVWWHLAAGRTKEATAIIEEVHRMTNAVAYDTSVALMQLRTAGAASPWAVRYVDQLLAGKKGQITSTGTALDHLWSLASRRTEICSLLERGEPATPRAITEAVCASRQGDLRASVDWVAKAEREGPLVGLDSFLWEVLTRPLALARSGEKVDGGVLEAVERYPRLVNDDLQALREAFGAGDLVRLKKSLERVIDSNHSDAIAGLALLWAARLAPAGPEREAFQRRAGVLMRASRMGIWLLKT